MKDCAVKAGLATSDKDTTQQLGRNLLKTFCNGESNGTIGEYHIERREDNHIDVYQEFGNTKEALREICKIIDMEYDGNWTTQQLGAKVVKHAEENASKHCFTGISLIRNSNANQ